MGCFVLLSTAVRAQSPQVAINISMDTLREYVNYQIEMKICELNHPTDRGDWFKPDTSKIDFSRLTAADVTCGKYSAGENYNSLYYGNQLFGWEKIFVFRISNISSRAWHPSMFIVLPMPYKAFITKIDLREVVFQEGKIIVVKDPNAKYENGRLFIDQSLKIFPAATLEGHPMEFIVGK
jgi:hypothetical protein